VIEEIRSYDDDPSEQAGTALDRALFGEHALGREIAGRPAEVRSLAFMRAPTRPRQPPSRSQVTSPSLMHRGSLGQYAHHSENKSPRRVRSAVAPR
jgi:hypothetical protein